MIKYSSSVNTSLNIRIHTNGSLRSVEWWKLLASVLPKTHLVIFAIDGLADTNHLYRVGTNFDKIIENAKAFIDSGGNAEWAYIRFKHNEHQVNEAKDLAKSVGFANFTMKDSSRWLVDTQFPVYDKSGNTTHYLEPSQYSILKFIDKKILDNYKSVVEKTTIDCYALRNKEIYIDAQGRLFPCCWLAMIPYQPMDQEAEVIPVRQEILKQYHSLVESLGGIDMLNPLNSSVKDIINSDSYQSIWYDYWNSNKLITCARSCGVLPDVFSTPKDQFISRELLNER
jgi:hypothetical protein